MGLPRLLEFSFLDAVQFLEFGGMLTMIWVSCSRKNTLDLRWNQVGVLEASKVNGEAGSCGSNWVLLSAENRFRLLVKSAKLVDLRRLVLA